MANQLLKITLDGRSNRLSPESFVEVVGAITELLKIVDANAWAVGNPRYTWRIVSARMNSPLALEIEPVRTLDDAPDFNVTAHVLRGISQLESEKASQSPRYFGREGLLQARRIVAVYRDGVSSIELEGAGDLKVTPTWRAGRSIEHLITPARQRPYEAYGSIEGKLRRVTIDDREGHRASEIQVIDRSGADVVQCTLSARMAQRLGKHFGRRVVLFGTVQYGGDHRPRRIQVDDFHAVKKAKLPTLEQIHSLGINISGDQDAADYIAGLRATRA